MAHIGKIPREIPRASSTRRRRVRSVTVASLTLRAGRLSHIDLFVLGRANPFRGEDFFVKFLDETMRRCLLRGYRSDRFAFDKDVRAAPDIDQATDRRTAGRMNIVFHYGIAGCYLNTRRDTGVRREKV